MARIKFSELVKQTMTPESIARSRKKAVKEIAAMELSELRDALRVTQVDLAERMKVSQAAISKLEKRNRNIHVDQLRSIVSAMGGNLIIIADFEDRKVELSHIGKPEDSYVKKARRHKTPAPKVRAPHSQSAEPDASCWGRKVRPRSSQTEKKPRLNRENASGSAKMSD
jgi:transcriptional regulator with XRE-family HTH domain